MQDAWVAFARDGPEGLRRGVGWMDYRSGEATVREFGGCGSTGIAVRDVNIAEMEEQCT